jgi:hypothetical protein
MKYVWRLAVRYVIYIYISRLSANTVHNRIQQ